MGWFPEDFSAGEVQPNGVTRSPKWVIHASAKAVIMQQLGLGDQTLLGTIC